MFLVLDTSAEKAALLAGAAKLRTSAAAGRKAGAQERGRAAERALSRPLTRLRAPRESMMALVLGELLGLSCGRRIGSSQ
jgi:hypothetical protein